MGTGNGRWLGGLSRETVLATRRLAALAARRGEGPAPTASRSWATDKEPAAACALHEKLQAAGLVERDAHGSGSFRLARSPEAITLFDISSAVGEPFELCTCLGPERARTDECSACPLDGVSRILRHDVIAFLRSRTLADVTPRAT